MAETDWHRELMTALIATLQSYFANEPDVYVSGNLLLFYIPHDRRRHVSPDVFVVKGVSRHARPNFLLWQERKGPECVIELTSSSTQAEDQEGKFQLYQNVLRVPEYFLFDPLGDYLDPPLKGYRLRRGQYHPIRWVKGRLPSQVLGLHLEGRGKELRLFNPRTSRVLPTPQEELEEEKAARQEEQAARQQAEAARQEEQAARQQAEAARQEEQAARQEEQAARQRAEAARQEEQAARQRAETARQEEQAARQRAEAEAERLRRELDELRRRRL
jgi:Uma2 family endonuclease